MAFPVVNAIASPLVASVVTIDSSHGVTGSHFSACDLAVDTFKACEEIRIVDLTLGYVIEQVSYVLCGQFVAPLVFDGIDHLCDKVRP
jgi:hypothetical protein